METDRATEEYLAGIRVIIGLLQSGETAKAKERLKQAQQPLSMALLNSDLRDKCSLLLETMSEYAYGLPPARLEDIVNDFNALLFPLPNDSKRRILETKG